MLQKVCGKCANRPKGQRAALVAPRATYSLYTGKLVIGIAPRMKAFLRRPLAINREPCISDRKYSRRHTIDRCSSFDAGHLRGRYRDRRFAVPNCMTMPRNRNKPTCTFIGMRCASYCAFATVCHTKNMRTSTTRKREKMNEKRLAYCTNIERKLEKYALLDDPSSG